MDRKNEEIQGLSTVVLQYLGEEIRGEKQGEKGNKKTKKEHL